MHYNLTINTTTEPFNMKIKKFLTITKTSSQALDDTSSVYQQVFERDSSLIACCL